MEYQHDEHGNVLRCDAMNHNGEHRCIHPLGHPGPHAANSWAIYEAILWIDNPLEVS